MSQIHFIELLLLASVTLSVATDYCNLQCGSEHTMCKFPNPGPGSGCNGYIKRPLTQSEKELIVDVHNKLRNKVASGYETGQPAASDMLQLQWDDELATVAQRWVDQCVDGHDKCRSSERFSVGQNYAWYSSTSKSINIPARLEGMIQDWYNEVGDMPASQVESFTNEGRGVIGHYTQVVWAETSLVGCGLLMTNDGRWTSLTLICNYGPAGNMLTEPIYMEGSPCSMCPDGTKCSSKYTALCA